MAEKILLVGGPGEGLELKWDGGDRLEWVPVTDLEKVTARTLGRTPTGSDPITYRRSVRTRNLFIYQP